jgi:hypothetical protein
LQWYIICSTIIIIKMRNHDDQREQIKPVVEDLLEGKLAEITNDQAGRGLFFSKGETNATLRI